jgi:hypothetical protein
MLQSAQRPYPPLFWTSRAAPAAMSCSTMGVWPSDAAKMSAVLLPRTRLASSGWHADVAVGTTALPFAVMDVEGSAGGDELLDHEPVALRRGPDERGVPAKKSVAALNSVRPMKSAQRPYPTLFWTSSPTPAAMSCSTTGVRPFIAAEMSAVSLPRSQLPRCMAYDAVGTTAVPFVFLDIEPGTGGDELLDHKRVALRRGPDESGVPAENSAGRFRMARRRCSRHNGPTLRYS